MCQMSYELFHMLKQRKLCFVERVCTLNVSVVVTVAEQNKLVKLCLCGALLFRPLLCQTSLTSCL